MDLFEGTYYRLNKRLLFYIGQWPLQTPNEQNFYRTTTVIIVGSILLVEVIRFIEYVGDLNGMIQCFPAMGPHLRSAVRFVHCIAVSKKMKMLANQIQDDWTERTSKIDEAILKTYAARGKLYTLAYVVYMFSTLATLFAMPLIPLTLDIVAPLNQSRERIYLIESEYFIERDRNYFYILIHSYIASSFALGIIVAYDTMYAVHVQHVCGLFAAIGVRLRSVGVNAVNKLEINNDSVKSKDQDYDEITDCIKMHNHAMKIADLIESTHTMLIFINVTASLIMITAAGFMTVTNLNEFAETVRFGVCVLGEIVHLLYWFWQGHQLMMHSENIFQDAYSVYWYDMSPQSKKLLILIMIRSLEPCKLTAGKMLDLSMENYATALKTSMSYFTVLLSVQ